MEFSRKIERYNSLWKQSLGRREVSAAVPSHIYWQCVKGQEAGLGQWNKRERCVTT